MACHKCEESIFQRMKKTATKLHFAFIQASVSGPQKPSAETCQDLTSLRREAQTYFCMHMSVNFLSYHFSFKVCQSFEVRSAKSDVRAEGKAYAVSFTAPFSDRSRAFCQNLLLPDVAVHCRWPWPLTKPSDCCSASWRQDLLILGARCQFPFFYL